MSHSSPYMHTLSPLARLFFHTNITINYYATSCFIYYRKRVVTSPVVIFMISIMVVVYFIFIFPIFHRRVIEKIDQSEFEGFEYVNPLLMSQEDNVWHEEDCGDYAAPHLQQYHHEADCPCSATIDSPPDNGRPPTRGWFCLPLR